MVGLQGFIFSLAVGGLDRPLNLLNLFDTFLSSLGDLGFLSFCGLFLMIQIFILLCIRSWPVLETLKEFFSVFTGIYFQFSGYLGATFEELGVS